MLGPGRYLLGIAELGLLVGFARLGATALRRRLLPGFDGATGALATAVLALALLLWSAELLGALGLFEPIPYLVLSSFLGLAIWRTVGGPWGGPSGEAASRFSPQPRSPTSESSPGEKPSETEGPPHGPQLSTLIALTIATAAVVKFALETKPH